MCIMKPIRGRAEAAGESGSSYSHFKSQGILEFERDGYFFHFSLYTQRCSFVSTCTADVVRENLGQIFAPFIEAAER